MMRFARFVIHAEDDVERIEALLPGNYAVTTNSDGAVAIVFGHDRAGWTLDGYVLPRLASGLLFGEEIYPPSCFTLRPEAFGIDEEGEEPDRGRQ